MLNCLDNKRIVDMTGEELMSLIREAMEAAAYNNARERQSSARIILLLEVLSTHSMPYGHKRRYHPAGNHSKRQNAAV